MFFRGKVHLEKIFSPGLASFWRLGRLRPSTTRRREVETIFDNSKSSPCRGRKASARKSDREATRWWPKGLHGDKSLIRKEGLGCNKRRRKAVASCIRGCETPTSKLGRDHTRNLTVDIGWRMAGQYKSYIQKCMCETNVRQRG